MKSTVLFELNLEVRNVNILQKVISKVQKEVQKLNGNFHAESNRYPDMYNKKEANIVCNEIPHFEEKKNIIGFSFAYSYH
jgi:hypothetical protein